MPKINKVKVVSLYSLLDCHLRLRNVFFFSLPLFRQVGRTNPLFRTSIKSSLSAQVSIPLPLNIRPKIGAFGKVYKVFHKKSKLFYAIKEMDKSQLKSNDMCEQIINEVKIMYSLNHENIIKLNNHFEDDKNVYLILEFASGVSPSYLILVELNVFVKFRDNYTKIFISNRGKGSMKRPLPKYSFTPYIFYFHL